MFASLHTATLTIRRVQSGGTAPRLFRLARLALAARRQRRHLLALDDTALQDIGLSRAEAIAEASRPVWDVPATWRR